MYFYATGYKTIFNLHCSSNTTGCVLKVKSSILVLWHNSLDNTMSSEHLTNLKWSAKCWVKWHTREAEAGNQNSRASKFKANHGKKKKKKDVFGKPSRPENAILYLKRPLGFCKTLNRYTEKVAMFTSLLVSAHWVFFKPQALWMHSRQHANPRTARALLRSCTVSRDVGHS